MNAMLSRERLRAWVASKLAIRPDDPRAGMVADWIADKDTDRPSWTDDWDEYLDGLDVPYILTGLGL